MSSSSNLQPSMSGQICFASLNLFEGKVYIASMNMRGEWASVPDEIDDNHIKINVTSAQGKTNKNRLAFSPMTEIVNGYKSYWNFESYWQAGKVFEDIPEETVKNYWKQLKEPKRRYPKSKDKKVLYAVFEGNPEKMGYITSRKKVYVPEYYELIKNRNMTSFWKKMLSDGHNLIIYDFDGPRTDDGGVTCLELTKELLIDKINSTNFPFGHGYVVAATIAGIIPQEYI